MPIVCQGRVGVGAYRLQWVGVEHVWKGTLTSSLLVGVKANITPISEKGR